MENQDTLYCGSAKIISTQYGQLTKVSFHKEDINKLVKFLRENGGDWINLTIKEMKEPKQGKPTHYLEIDTWKPEQKQEQPQQQSYGNDEKLPF